MPKLWVRCTAWRRLRNRRPDHVEGRHVDHHVAADGHRPQRLADNFRVAPQFQSPFTAAQHDDPPAVGVTHRHEVRDELGEPGLVTDRVATDHRVAQPGAVGDGRGAVGGEVVALARQHRERRHRIATGRIHQRPDPRQFGRVGGAPWSATSGPARNRRSGRCPARRRPGCGRRNRPAPPARQRRVGRGHRPAQEDAPRDQGDGGQDRQRPGQPAVGVPVRVVMRPRQQRRPASSRRSAARARRSSARPGNRRARPPVRGPAGGSRPAAAARSSHLPQG